MKFLRYVCLLTFSQPQVLPYPLSGSSVPGSRPVLDRDDFLISIELAKFLEPIDDELPGAVSLPVHLALSIRRSTTGPVIFYDAHFSIHLHTITDLPQCVELPVFRGSYYPLFRITANVSRDSGIPPKPSLLK